MKTVFIYLTVFLAIGLLAFVNADKFMTPNNESEVAELLNRNEKIRLDKEWDFVQNYYQDKKLAIEKNTNDFKSKLELAELFIKEARVTGEHGHYYPAALKLTSEVVEKAKSADLVFQGLVTKAGVQLSLHEFEQALITGNAALQLNASSAQVYGVLVDCYVELGKYDKAVKMADKMVSIKPDIRSYSRVSYLRELHGDISGAQVALAFAIKSGFPGYEETAWAMLTLGEFYVEQGEYDKADNVFNQILSTRSNYPFAIAAKANVAYLKGDLKAAEALLDESVAIIPEVGFFVQLAMIYKDQNRTEQFNTTMNEIFVMLQDDENSGHNMNLEYAQIYKDVLIDYDKAHDYAMIEWKKRPENVSVNRLMSQIELLRNQKDDANKYLDLASAIYPEHPELSELRTALN